MLSNRVVTDEDRATLSPFYAERLEHIEVNPYKLKRYRAVYAVLLHWWDVLANGGIVEERSCGLHTVTRIENGRALVRNTTDGTVIGGRTNALEAAVHLAIRRNAFGTKVHSTEGVL